MFDNSSFRLQDRILVRQQLFPLLQGDSCSTTTVSSSTGLDSCWTSVVFCSTTTVSVSTGPILVGHQLFFVRQQFPFRQDRFLLDISCFLFDNTFRFDRTRFLLDISCFLFDNISFRFDRIDSCSTTTVSCSTGPILRWQGLFLFLDH